MADWNSSSHPISDIRDWSKNNRLEIRPDFQRKEVWSSAAKIMLMDTILQNIPMPKIFLQAIIRDNDTYRIVIDGQQRIKAILDFLLDRYALSSPYKGKFLNKKFSGLPKVIQQKILSYKIDVNEIRNTDEKTIREIYSRVNKYTFQLTKQELRRADFPGDFLELSEKLAGNAFFEDSRIFTVANSKRMGDVEYVSELIALLLDGPQEKKESLDRFYEKYMVWNKQNKKQLQKTFGNILADIDHIWKAKLTKLREFGVPYNDFCGTRFRQKSDFYSLFYAIYRCQEETRRIRTRINAEYLLKDFLFLDANISPSIDVPILQKYAIQCISQSNSIGSRQWRSAFLKRFLMGTYSPEFPDAVTISMFHDILSGVYCPGICPAYYVTCPVCNKECNGYETQTVFLTWEKKSQVHQLSNAVFIHQDCKKTAQGKYHIPTTNFCENWDRLL